MPEKTSEKPYIPAESTLPEFTFKAIFLGLVMAVVLGAANAYLGLRAGQTVSASFPAAVIAIAAFRILRGSVLEQNIARTTASVGEALVAGAIFTIPAFVIANVGGERVWTDFNYWETSFILLIGGVLAWLVLIPLILFVNPELSAQLSLNGQTPPIADVINSVWYNHVRPIAGESLTGVLLAVLVLVVEDFESLTRLLFGVSEFEFVKAWGGNLIGLLAFAAIAWVLIVMPLWKSNA
ncbi:MAG: OPT/YSL family transporter [candidate division KSB1 bacterium]|nr:OPT/YSL family transporter [candidate division KSB1 bacterium]MDZ7366586.1 OPT/YSL family transporter [candidate division KSB1 bacterium]MDZ7406696.1 OPT/YSL family transporter [candidate division KSB1 bacterium]